MNVSWGKVSTALGVVIWLTNGTVIASTPITGIAMEGPFQNQSGTVAALPRTYGWVSLNETLSPGQRLVMNQAFFDDLFQEFPFQSEINIGIKDPVNWSNTAQPSSGAFVNDQYIRIVKYSSGNTIARHYTQSSYTGLDDAVLNWEDYEAFFELTADGNNIRYGQRQGTYHGHPAYTHDINTTQYPDWESNNKTETGQQGYGYTSAEIVIRMSGNTSGQQWDTANIDWTALTLRSIPAHLNITYDTQGGPDVTDGDATTTTGGTINALPSDPTRDGYTFTGWYTATSGGTEITTEAAHNQTTDFTLYAQWTANPTTTTVAPTTTTAAPTTTTTTAAPTTSMLPATGSSNGTLSQVLLVLGVGGLLVLVARRRLNVCDSRDSPLEE